MSTDSFDGVWSYPSLEYAGEKDFMCIDESRGRIVTFVAFIGVESHLRRLPMRHWYQRESPGTILARLEFAGPAKPHSWVLENDSLVWTYGGRQHAWQRVSREDFPDWLEAKLAVAHARMDLAEK
jgi:hypothetical protein